MFFALLRRQSIAIYRRENPAPIVVNLPVNLVSNLEVKDQKGLTDFLAGFLKSINSAADEGVLLLTDEVNFCRSFPNDESKQTSEQIQTFLSLVPFGKSVFISKEFVRENKKWVCASNRSLCIGVIYGFQAADLKITLVLPAFVVGVSEQTVFGAEMLDRITNTLAIDKPYSMLANIFAGEKKSWWKF